MTPQPLVKPLPPSSLTPEVAALAEFFGGTLGLLPNSVATMAHKPAVATAFAALNRAVMAGEGRVSPALKRDIGYVASLAAGCRYCQAHTVLAADRFGETGDRLAALPDYANSPLFSDAERAAFDFALAAAAVPNAVGPEIAAALKAHWTDGEIVEILGVIALFGFLNRWNDSMGTTLEAPALSAAERHVGAAGWTAGKHGGGPG